MIAASGPELSTLDVTYIILALYLTLFLSSTNMDYFPHFDYNGCSWLWQKEIICRGYIPVKSSNKSSGQCSVQIKLGPAVTTSQGCRSSKY